MKKKLNLLWNLKFNFFSVAERPLTFFAYFLNAKKVGRRRLVIVPATAGGLPLFPHAASVPAPALAPVRSHFTPRTPPCAVVRFAAMTSSPRTSILPSPSRLCRAGSPTAKTRPLLPFGRISPAAKPGWPVVAPAGGNVLATPFSLCSNVAPHIPAGSAGVRSFVPRLAPRSHPGARRLTPPFRLRRNRACGHRPHLLGLPRKIRRGISLRETTLCGCPLRGHGFATPHQYFAVPVTAAPRRVPNGKNPALAPIRSHFACGETGLAGRCPRWGQRARYPIFALLKCGPALAPRRSSAYASVSPAAKPRVRSSAPPFGFAAQNQARHFAARNHPVRLSASRP